MTSIAGVDGICAEATQEIRYDGKLGPDTERETILHEVLHAVWGMSTLDRLYTDEQEEQIIWTLAPLIRSLLLDNPDFVRYLLEYL